MKSDTTTSAQHPRSPFEVSPTRTRGRIERTLSLDLETFDALKHWSRKLAAFHGRELTNGETVRALILAHDD